MLIEHYKHLLCRILYCRSWASSYPDSHLVDFPMAVTFFVNFFWGLDVCLISFGSEASVAWFANVRIVTSICSLVRFFDPSQTFPHLSCDVTSWNRAVLMRLNNWRVFEFTVNVAFIGPVYSVSKLYWMKILVFLPVCFTYRFFF